MAINDKIEGQGIDHIVEGGEISYQEIPRFDVRKHKADTTRWLAVSFVVIFSLSFFGHYIASAIFHGMGMEKTAEFVTSVFDKWSIGITALTGSIVTYYFSKEK